METTVCKKCGHFEFYYEKTFFKDGSGNFHLGEYCQSCGERQRWVPQNKNKDPYEVVFYCGKYKGQKVMEICKTDPRYCHWIYDNKDKDSFKWIKEPHITALELGLEL